MSFGSKSEENDVVILHSIFHRGLAVKARKFQPVNEQHSIRKASERCAEVL